MGILSLQILAPVLLATSTACPYTLWILFCSRVTVLEPFPGVECEHALGAPQPFLLACIRASPVLARTRNSMVAE